MSESPAMTRMRLVNLRPNPVKLITPMMIPAQAQAAAWQQVIVLKGAYTVVAAPDGRTVLMPFANPGLASGGTGDVLAGTIVALRAQGLGAFEAAWAGAYLHGTAGELARIEIGASGTVAGDLLDRLPRAWRSLANG